MLKEETKYYTPILEEFRPGFEYEVLDTDGTPGVLPDWFEMEFAGGLIKIQGWNIPLTTIKKQIAEKDIRVKYLDKEDIEGLGFKLIKDFLQFNEENTYQFCIIDKEDSLGRKLYLHFHSGYTYSSETNERIERLSSVSIRWHKEHIKSEEDINGIYDLFNGEIKNISELKVLLKQLGIDDKTN